MKRIALLTAVALSIPTAAFAWPHWRVADRDDPQRTYDRDRDHDRDHDRDRDRRGDDGRWNRERYERYERSHWVKDFRGRWTPLARGYNARTDRQFINLGGERYRKLRIEGVRGEPVILKIAIEFSDKTGQAVEYRESLPSGTGEVIDLTGGDRRINRIIIYTDPHSRGTYSVYGA
jgi:Ni/Co efflux regulator RcnB